ncbi:MAG TPA: hypothetical protein PKZ36_01015 [Candidatus Paceibacterota bacterium]|nr:hypothetical protein [Candidatus Paceibacterota bacterium]HPT17971.1 hypothetical protein [Candidatus Paceibacterota bacterium]
MEKGEKIEWSMLEYEEKERNIDWFWALGVIIVASAAASIIFKNYFFAALLVIGGVMLGYFAVKKPEVISYELNEDGLKIHNILYPFEDIKCFWVQKETKPTLFVKTKRVIMPIISIPIELSSANKIHDVMLKNNIVEEEMKEHFSNKIMEVLGF